jgi:hypothetical protein
LSPVTAKSLDEKLARIRSGKYRPTDFIIADAKDADMGFGLTAPGPVRTPDGRTGHTRSRADYLNAMRVMVSEELVDIMLTSASSMQTLAEEGLFDESRVTPAVRLNDATDIWHPRGSRYSDSPSRPFATPSLDRIRPFCDLGLYSITFSNDRDCDLETLMAYAAFRREVADHRLRYFLEIFDPAFDIGVPHLGAFVNDSIVRALAGVASPDRPLFLKTAYNGPAALEELAAYDPGGLIVGILGGSRGTTRDTFELLAQVEKHGARVALFGRKINLAEDPRTLVVLIRQVVEGSVSPNEAVKAYHAALHRSGIRADRPLEDDLEITDAVLRRAP